MHSNIIFSNKIVLLLLLHYLLIKIVIFIFVAQLVPCAGASGPWPCLLIPESTWISNRAHYAINNKLANGTKPLALAAKPKSELAMHLGWQLKDKELLIKIITRLCRCYTLLALFYLSFHGLWLFEIERTTLLAAVAVSGPMRVIYTLFCERISTYRSASAQQNKK